MFELISEYAWWGLAAINFAAISVGLYKKVHNALNTPQRIRKLPYRHKRNAVDVFVTINPYLLGLTYAYSAYRFISRNHDSVAYVGTFMAAGQLYLEYKSAHAKRNDNETTVIKHRKYGAANF